MGDGRLSRLSLRETPCIAREQVSMSAMMAGSFLGFFGNECSGDGKGPKDRPETNMTRAFENSCSVKVNGQISNVKKGK